MIAEHRQVRSTDGTQIGVIVAGQGPPVVLLHGICASAASWLPLVQMLRSDHRVYSVDRRGRGLSGDQQHHDLDLEVADFLSVLSMIDEPVTVLGHSYGATVALLAAARTDRVARLIAYEPLLVPPAAALEGAAKTIEELVSDGDFDTAVSHLLDQFDMPGLVPTLRNIKAAWNRLAGDVHTVPRELRSLATIDARIDDLAHITCPVTLLAGDATLPAFLLSSVEAHRRIQHVDVKILEGHNHFATLTAPDLVARHVLTVGEPEPPTAPADGIVAGRREGFGNTGLSDARIVVGGVVDDGVLADLGLGAAATDNVFVAQNDSEIVCRLTEVHPEVVVASVATWVLIKQRMEHLIFNGPDAENVLLPILEYALAMQDEIDTGDTGAPASIEIALLTAAFSRLRRKVGLKNAVWTIAVGGDLPRPLQRWFRAVGVSVVDANEMTSNASVCIVTSPDHGPRGIP